MADGSTPTFREAPHSIEAEQALLGAIFVWNEAYHHVSTSLGPEHFFDPLHAEIFAHMGELISVNRHASPVTLGTYFEHYDPIEETIAGPSGERSSVTVPQYLGRLAANATTLISVKEYAKTIRDLATRRNLVRIGMEMVQAAFENPIDFAPSDQIVAAEQALYDLAEKGPRSAQEIDFGDAAQQAIDLINAAYQRGGKLLGLESGLGSLDDKMGGLAPSDLIVLGGRPGMGKTALVTTIAFFNAYERMLTQHREDPGGCYVHFFSQEMSASQLAIRVLAGLTELDSERIRRGSVNEDDMRKLIEQANRMGKLPLKIDETGGLSLAQVCAKARRTKRERGTGLIVIDYLQLMDDGNKENRTQGLTHITKGLKSLAKELNVPIIVLSQLNRKVEDRNDKRPQLADLRESGAIEQDADIVLFAFREEYYAQRDVPDPDDPEAVAKHQARLLSCQGKAEVIIAKHRHAPTGIVHCGFDAPRARFHDLSEPHPDMGGR